MAEPTTHAFEQLAAGIYLEGLAVDHERSVIWYSDVIGGGIHGIKPDGTPVASFDQDRMWTGGVMLNHDGAVLSTGQGGFRWNDANTGRSGWLLDTLDGKPINGINEMVPDGTGGMFFGTNDIEMVIAGQPARPSEIWRLTATREVIKLADGIGFTNGLAYDAERRRLYCNDTFYGTLVFEVCADLTLANKRLFLGKEDADGMALDLEGNLWITGFRSNFFSRMSPDGTLLERYDTPAGSITQLRFGGADGCDVYFNSVPADGGDTLKEGGAMTARNSFVYRGRSRAPGLRIAPARFDLA